MILVAKGLIGMFEAYWGLREAPFRGLIDRRSIFCSTAREEAMARLQFLADNQRKLGLLVGVAGSGKTLLLDEFRRQQRAVGHATVMVNLLSVDVRAFLWDLATQLGRNPGCLDSPFQLWRMCLDRLEEFRYQRIAATLLLDDADEMTPEIGPYLIRLLQLDTAGTSSITLVLAANSLGLGRLSRRLLDLCDLRVDLDVWEVDETHQFLQQSLARAGANREVFTPDAARLLHELAGGVPRQIVRLAELALVAGAGQQLERIDTGTLESVAAELSPTSVAQCGPLGSSGLV
jgi:type II secretory pathway predicted ATPase ExeA